MQRPTENTWDVIVVGSGIGSLSAAAILAKHGRRVLVLEANYLPGGCCSSYWRKGYVFESGATTLMGFDPGQPLHLLQQELGEALDLPLVSLDPAMRVSIDGQTLLRYRDPAQWVDQTQRAFGQPEAQARFWGLAQRLSDFVWRVSGKNLRFPPQSLGDLLSLATRNNPADFPMLRFAFQSTLNVLGRFGLARNEPFIRFLNEQLMITAQNTVAETPMLFAAPALCYTNATNYNLRGGMIELPVALMAYIGKRGGDVRLRQAVTAVVPQNGTYQVTVEKGPTYRARQVLSGIPAWNVPGILTETSSPPFRQAAAELSDYWGAFTMGIAVEDTYSDDLPLHHQLILPRGQALPHTASHSVFVSFSLRGDTLRAPAGERVLAISTHAKNPGAWFALSTDAYEAQKQAVTEAILAVLDAQLPGFSRTRIRYLTSSTPVSWQQWTLRHVGTVGGVPQSLSRPLYTWLGAKSPLKGFYRCGDTVYPGQGVPGVALGGIIAAKRMLAQ